VGAFNGNHLLHKSQIQKKKNPEQLRPLSQQIAAETQQTP
jgi:hypothetical protein